MGKVYRDDTKLKPGRGRDQDFRRRPWRVIRIASRGFVEKPKSSSLNHPNIAAIYGFEDVSGVHALVLELVEGRTLEAFRRRARFRWTRR